MTNPRIARLVAPLVLLALAACASTPPAPATKSRAAANPPVGCVATPTGLLAPPKDCAGFGHTWTRENIERTGAPTTADALRLLDPTLTVTGH